MACIRRPGRRGGAAGTLFALLLAVALAGCGQPARSPQPRTGSPTPPPTPTAQETHVRTGTAAKEKLPLGVYAPGAISSWAPVADFARGAGQPVRYALAYLGPDDPFPADLAMEAAAHGAELVLQIEPVASMKEIVAGEDDQYLNQLAAAIRSYGYPVIVSFAAEANGDWYSYGAPHTPVADYRAAWAHVMRQFGETPNVTWMATLNRTYAGAAPTRDYVIPGVGMYGIDAYYVSADDTFETVFVPTIRQIRAVTNKPILINETGIGQVNDQARSIPGLVRGALEYRLAGLVYFNLDEHSDSPYHQNWALTADGMRALRNSLRSGDQRP